MTDPEADKIVNPPLIGVSDDQALCPPTSPPEYMAWLAENREVLWRYFFGELNIDGICPRCGSQERE